MPLTLEGYLQRLAPKSAKLPRCIIPELTQEKVQVLTQVQTASQSERTSLYPEYDMDVLVALHSYIFTFMSELTRTREQQGELWDLVHLPCMRALPQLFPQLKHEVAQAICTQLQPEFLREDFECNLLPALRHLEVWCGAPDKLTALLQLQATCLQDWLLQQGLSGSENQAYLVNCLMDICDFAGVDYQYLQCFCQELSERVAIFKDFPAQKLCRTIALDNLGWNAQTSGAEVLQHYQQLLADITDQRTLFTQQPSIMHKLVYNRSASSLRLLKETDLSFKEYLASIEVGVGAELELITELSQE